MEAKHLILALAYNYKMPTQQNTGKQKGLTLTPDLRAEVPNPPVCRKLKGKEFKLSLGVLTLPQGYP